MGGLDPLDPDGGKFVASIHTGKTSNGHDFADAYPKFESEVVEAFGEFLDNVLVSPKREGAPTRDDSEDEEDNSGQQVDHAEEENDEEMNEEDGDGVDDPPPHTYTPSPPSNSATLATSPASHLATPPAPHAATSTSSNLATDVFSHQLAISPHGTQVATSPASHLAIPLAAYPVTSAPGNFATLSVTHPATPASASLVACPATSAPGNLATLSVTHPAIPVSTSLATLPAAHPATSVPSHLSPTTPLSVTNASGSSPTDTLGGESFTSLLNSDDTLDWLDFGSSDTWSVPFASSSDLAAAGSQVGFGVNIPNYPLMPPGPGMTSLHDLELVRNVRHE
ncbi:hypothetical protein JVT61DRAFT_14679 [Boletus reticuloceps]|uniref:Uncharacterized protein n=1 Tax=Boletus reticuloceps TaxID=495285 RepID=A0A8I2YUG5_9AGAM|nr:hypothetical protein JVT61DRAFT_14679 [Boletus reticuloceps]